MGIKSNTFFLDLETINQKVDDKLKQFAKDEELDVEDIVKIVQGEAKKLGLRGRVKVTFKILDNSDDGFRVIVEPATIKYKGTTIIPFKTIKSDDFEISLDEVCGKVTLYNRKDALKKLSLTIDGIGLDLFVMTYEKAREYLIGLSDRKVKNGYKDLEDGVCFYEFGIKINAKINDEGRMVKNALFESVDVYSKYEFERTYEFSIESEEAKYDVQIPMEEPKKEEEFKLPEIKEYDPSNRYDYTIPEFSMDEINRKDEEERKRLEQKVKEEIDIILPKEKEEEPEEVIEIDLGVEETKVEETSKVEVEVKDETPVETVEETTTKVEEKEAEVEETETEEYEEPKTKEQVALEEEIKEQANLELELARKFEEGLTKKLENIKKESEEKKKEKLENKLEAAKEVDNDNILLEDEEVEKEETTPEIEVELPEEAPEVEEETIEVEIPEEEKVNDDVEKLVRAVEVKLDPSKAEEETKVEEKTEVKDEEKEVEEEHVVPEATRSMQKEILELERLLLREKEQQRALEERIVAKLDELKKVQMEIADSKTTTEVAKEEPKTTVEKKVEPIIKIEPETEVKTEPVVKPVVKAEPVIEPKVQVKPEIKEEPIVELPKKEVIEKVEYKEPENYISYDIVVYQGIKRSTSKKVDVYIGQDKDEIRAYFKSVPKEVRDFEEMEVYDTFYAYYDDEDKCTGIGIYNQEIYKDKIALNLFGKNLITMTYKEIVALIKEHDLGAIEDEDGIISLKLGISVDPKESRNYKDMICDVIHIFKKGYYDEVYK